MDKISPVCYFLFGFLKKDDSRLPSWAIILFTDVRTEGQEDTPVEYSHTPLHQ
ncbi:MAG TPA: hypothetical protein VJH71_02880 [Candidatus Paceibacterota bacterium]